MKKAFYSILLFVPMLSCQNKSSEKEKTFLNSSNIAGIPFTQDGDSTFSNYSLSRRFILINEEAFLNAKGYDYYLIYEFGGVGMKNLIYTVKSLNGICSVSKKELINSEHLFLYAKEDKVNNESPISICSTNKIVGDSAALLIKKAADNCKGAIHKITKSNSIEDAYSVLYYYNGSDYYYISNNTVPAQLMKTTDSIVQHFPMFLTLAKDPSSEEDR